MANLNPPFDVLHIIFSYYQETLEFPLETLLLVCRYWNVAALECKTIWSRFKLDIKDIPSALFWSHTLPHRLERSGPSSPIYFTLRMDIKPHCGQSSCSLTDGFKCKCYETLTEAKQSILKAVLGPDGSLCARWREIDIRFPSQMHINGPFFGHPTPQLTLLSLHRVLYDHGGASFLPSAPTLREIKVNDCGLPDIPDTRNAIYIRLRDSYDPHTNNGNTTDPRGLVDAKKVQYLLLEIRGPWRRYNLPTNLPSLLRPYLAGDTMPQNMENVQTPALRVLRIKFDEYNDTQFYNNEYDLPIRKLVKCNGIPFHQLDTLKIEFVKQYFVEITETNWDAYDKLLRMCSNVKKISGDDTSTVFILKLLKADCVGARALANRTLVIRNGKKVREIRAGKEERLEDIKKFTEELGWPEMEEDRKIFIRKAP